jgi:transcriptional regulator with XRE-family HTH domain
MDLTTAIKRLRQSLNMSQQAFANELGLSIGAITNYERGREPEGKSLGSLYQIAMKNGQFKVADVFREKLVKEMGVAGRLTALGALASYTIGGINADLALMLNDFKYGSEKPVVKIGNAIKRLEKLMPELDKLNLHLPRPTGVKGAGEEDE